MGMFDQFKAASQMMKNMNPDQLKELMEQAKESQKLLEDQIRRIVDEEIKKRDLVSRKDIQKYIS